MGSLGVLLRLATHPRTVLWLIIATLGSFLLSELFPQTAINSPAYFQRLAQEQPLLATILDRLALCSFSSSPWFLTLTTLLALSLTITISQQAGRLFTHKSKPAGPLPDNALWIRVLGQSLDGLVHVVRGILCHQGYRLLGKPPLSSPLDLVFGKQQQGRCGSLLLHLGLLVLIIGALSGYFYQSRGFIQVMAGETILSGSPEWLETEHGALANAVTTDFSFQLDKLSVDFWPDGSRKWVDSTLTVIGTDGKSRIIQPSLGNPIEHAGLTFFQTNHIGYHVSLIIKRPGQPGIPTHFMLDAGRRPADIPHAKTDFPLTDYLFEISLYPGTNHAAFFLNQPEVAVTVTNIGDIVFMGRLQPGQGVALSDGNNLYCQNIGYWSGITLQRGLALPLVYLGFALITVGVCLIYFLVPRKIIFRLEPLPEKGYGITMVAAGRNNASLLLEKEISTIRQQLSNLS